MVVKSEDDFYEIVIVGSGIIGSTCAYFLGKNSGEQRIALFEENTISSGTTKYSLGLRTTQFFNPNLKELCEDSFSLYDKMKREIENFPEIELPTFFLVQKNKINQKKFITKNSKLFNVDSILRNFSATNIKICNNEKAILGSKSFLGNAEMASKTLIEQFLKSSNHSVQENSKITNVVKQENGHFKIVVNGNRSIFAKSIIFCCGPSVLFQNFNLEHTVPLRTKKIVSLRIKLNVPVSNGVLYLDEDEAFLVSSDKNDFVLFSITSNEWDVLPPFEKLQISKNDYANANTILTKYFGESNYSIISSTVHCDIYSEDRIPRIIATENMYCITATSGSGYKYAPALAEELSKKIYQ